MSVLAHKSIGTGARQLLFLHGFLGSGKNLATLARGLSTRLDATATMLDLTGHGQSPPLPSGADLHTLAADVLETATALGLERPDVVGHSLGGLVALAACERTPAWASRVTMLDIAPGPIRHDETDQVFAALLAAPASAPSRDAMVHDLMARGLSQSIADWLAMNVEHQPGGGFSWRIDRAALAALRPRVKHADLWPAVERRVIPMRCIRGGRSRHVGDDDATRLVAAGVEVITVAGAGHFVHVDRPAELLELLAD